MKKSHKYHGFTITSLPKKDAVGNKWEVVTPGNYVVARGKTIRECESKIAAFGDRGPSDTPADPEKEKMRHALKTILSNLERNDAVTMLCIPQMVNLAREALGMEKKDSANT